MGPRPATGGSRSPGHWAGRWLHDRREHGLSAPAGAGVRTGAPPFRPYWFEEPVAPLDAAGHAWLRERLPLKIATGENLYLTQGFEPLWRHKACDYVMPDILRCGGFEQTRQICLEAIRHGVVPSPHNFSSGVGLAATLHLMAALPETEWLEFDPTGTAIYEELFVEPLCVERGRVRVPEHARARRAVDGGGDQLLAQRPGVMNPSNTSDHHLVHANVARDSAPLDSPMMADFVSQIDEINSLARRARGFVVRNRRSPMKATSQGSLLAERLPLGVR